MDSAGPWLTRRARKNCGAARRNAMYGMLQHSLAKMIPLAESNTIGMEIEFMKRKSFAAGLALLLLASAAPLRAGELFADQVAPILRQRCTQCHNALKTKGGLDLTTRDALLKGGEKGVVVIPGNAAKSRILDMVSGETPRMPKQGAKLTPEEIANLKKWIDGGAVWPNSVLLTDADKRRAGPDWWSLQPLKPPALPAVKDSPWVRNEIDTFILATL
jgi:mono/diheme cytochrome c family protein